MIARRGEVPSSLVAAVVSAAVAGSWLALFEQAASAAAALIRPVPFTKNLRVICVSMYNPSFENSVNMKIIEVSFLLGFNNVSQREMESARQTARELSGTQYPINSSPHTSRTSDENHFPTT
jgi:hypothetical protein